MTLYIIPQLRVRGRYQEWYPDYWGEEAKKYFEDVAIILPYPDVYEKTNYFTNVQKSIENELEQIVILNSYKPGAGDAVLWLDIDFPGFAYPYTFFLKQMSVRVYGILHGYYRNPGDVWAGTERREYYLGCLKNMDAVFVGTRSFKEMLVRDLELERDLADKIIPAGLPFLSEKFIMYRKYVKFMKTVMDKTDRDPESYEEVLKHAGRVILKKRAETFGYTLLELLAAGARVACPRDVPVYCEWKERFGDGILLYDRGEAEEDVFDRLGWIESVPPDHEVFKYLAGSAARILSTIAEGLTDG